MADILHTILENKREEIRLLKEKFTVGHFEQQEHFKRECISMKNSIRSNEFGIIAEIKRKSPSAGDIQTNVDVAEYGKNYEAGGASAISCLTDNKFFGGSIEDLKKLRTSTSLPILRKDFIIDYIQVFEAKAAGADAILLIAEALPKKEINNLIQLAHDMDMEVLLEAHALEEIEKTYGQADMIGINNRNLKTQTTNIQQSLDLIKFLPQNKLKITESGIRTAEELRTLSEAGFGGALIGESILKNSAPKDFIKSLIPHA